MKTKRRVSLECVKTEPGNQILDSLKSDGWTVVKQYSPLAFDKGIDFDAYTLVKEGRRVDFEWTNWFEWTIRGDPELMHEVDLMLESKKSDAIQRNE